MRFAITFLLTCFFSAINAQFTCTPPISIFENDEPPGCYLCYNNYPSRTGEYSPDEAEYEFNLGEIENSQWYTFETGEEGFLKIVLEPQSCQDAKGLEAALYNENLDLVAEVKSSSNIFEPLIIESDELLPRKNYHLMIDGVEGDNCFFLISYEGNVSISEVIPTIRAESGGTSFCKSSVACFSVNPVRGASGYSWSKPSFCTIESGGDATDTEICLSFDDIGFGLIRVVSYNNCEVGAFQQMSIRAWETIVVNERVSLCPLEIADHQFQDTCIVTSGGCDSCIVYEVIETTRMDFSSQKVICPDNCVQIGDSCFSTTGFHSVVFEDATSGGCDSVVSLFLTVEDVIPSAGISCKDSLSSFFVEWDTVFGVEYYQVSINRDSIITITDNSIFLENADFGSSVYLKVQPFGSCNYLPTEITCNSQTSIIDFFILKDEIVIFPNPTTGQISIETDLEILEVEVYDATGRIVQKEVLRYFKIKNTSKGIYFLKIKTQKGIAVKRVLVQ